MRTIPLLSIALQLQLRPFTHGSEATIDAASGETTIIADDDPPPALLCEPEEMLNGKSSCDTFQIATLNASPRRCIHIESPPPNNSNDDDDASLKSCTDYPKWHDGTNSCSAYSRPGYCLEYGNLEFSQHTPHKPNEACCACGGGTLARPRLSRGDAVAVSGYGHQDDCDSFVIERLVHVPGGNHNFHYLLRLQKPCGPTHHFQNARGGISSRQVWQEGHRLAVESDDPSVIHRLVRVELRKCRRGHRGQEFTISPAAPRAVGEGAMAVIAHKLTGAELAAAVGGGSPLVNVSRVFEDGLFRGSGDYHYLRITREKPPAGMQYGGMPDGPQQVYLASGHFGQTEFSKVEMQSTPGFEEQEFSMWKFQPVTENEAEDDASDVDEHAQWLMRMTQMMGIDYLVQLPPWHLLDVDRDASKSDVKSRFRELSRSFHPDKQVNQSEKKRELFERIFVLLQNAYQGLKSADEAEKEKFRVEAESGSQLFAHSQYVVELLPFHWTKLDNTTEEGTGRYILNAASHLNSTLLGTNSADEEEFEPSVQVWVTFMYSARCGMSRSVVGMVDLAARHLEHHDNIKVGAYGCGLYKEYPPKEDDPTGVRSDPICAQFKRPETPNVHVIVETIPGRKRDETTGELVEVYPDMEIVKQNAQFKYLYAAVPTGNITQFFPQNFINFAKAGKGVMQDTNLVTRMKRNDFLDPNFIRNVSIVAYLDGTGLGETNTEVADAIQNSLPGFARRFLNDALYIGTAECGFGDDEVNDEKIDEKYVDCSKLDVSWLPDIKVYGANDTEGVSLLRGQFSDARDVQIALESMGNTLRMMLGGTDNDYEVTIDEIPDVDDAEDSGGGCDNTQPPPPQQDYQDLDEIEGPMEETPLLEAQAEEEHSSESKAALDEAPRKPKLAGGNDAPQLARGRENNMARDRISGFQQRATRQPGGGQMLGGGGGGSAGFIA